MGLSDFPAADGYAPADVRANVGAAKSYGFELTLTENHNFNKDVWLRTNLTFTYATSRYTSYEEMVPAGMDWLKTEGTYLGQQKGLIAERLFIDETDIANSPKQTFDKVNDIPVMPGDIKYKDINNDGIIDSHDVVPIGYSSVPQIEGGFGASFGFYGFDVNFFMQGASKVSFMIDPYCQCRLGQWFCGYGSICWQSLSIESLGRQSLVGNKPELLCFVASFIGYVKT